jgi:hypothetical protein
MPGETWTVTVGEGCAEGAPLGLVLDKQASFPTIKKISGCAQAAADAGAKIAARQRLVSVGEDDVSGLDYLATVDTVRAHRERPLLLTLADPVEPLRSISQLTPSEMEARSKAATAEGIKQLRAAMLAKTDDALSESDSELSSDEGSEEWFGERAPQRSHRSRKPSDIRCSRKSNGSIRKLEERERRMQLEAINAQAEKADAEDEKAKLLAEVVLPIRAVEQELHNLKKKAEQSTFKTGSGSTVLNEQLQAWHVECEAHSKKCADNLQQLSALPTVKAHLTSVLNTEMAVLERLERDWMQKLRWAERWEWAKTFSVWCVVAGVVVHVAQHVYATTSMVEGE